jgi:hypothetical protein
MRRVAAEAVRPVLNTTVKRSRDRRTGKRFRKQFTILGKLVKTGSKMSTAISSDNIYLTRMGWRSLPAEISKPAVIFRQEPSQFLFIFRLFRVRSR